MFVKQNLNAAVCVGLLALLTSTGIKADTFDYTGQFVSFMGGHNDLSNPAQYFDDTTNATATVAPGVHDTVNLSGQFSVSQGESALQFGTLNIAPDSSILLSGGDLKVGTLNLQGTGIDEGTLHSGGSIEFGNENGALTTSGARGVATLTAASLLQVASLAPVVTPPVGPELPPIQVAETTVKNDLLAAMAAVGGFLLVTQGVRLVGGFGKRMASGAR